MDFSVTIAAGGTADKPTGRWLGILQCPHFLDLLRGRRRRSIQFIHRAFGMRGLLGCEIARLIPPEEQHPQASQGQRDERQQC